MKSSLFLAPLLASIFILAACAGGDATPTPTPIPTATPTPIVSEETSIKAAIERVYDLISQQRFSELWQTYSSEWRKMCSFDAMVNTLQELRAQGVTRLEVSGFTQVEFLGDRARATYTVVGFDDTGHQTASYDYDFTLVKEDKKWLAEEACF